MVREMLLWLVAALLLWQVKGQLGSCTLEKVMEDVAVNVVSEAATLFVSNEVKLEGLGRCRPRDCADIQQRGQSKSGVYRVWPLNGDRCGIQVYCDLEKDEGGWTVVQRRGDFGKPKEYFYKLWRDYKFGFGNISEDFWMGNDKIFQISNQDNYILRVDLKANDGESKYAIYDQFFIDSEDKKYTLHVAGYSGDAGDSLIGHNDLMFTTQDMDNDRYDKNCAEQFKGAWWYAACHSSNLNGQYLNGNHDSFADGVIWYHWKGHHFSYKDVVMKIRPKWFNLSQHV